MHKKDSVQLAILLSPLLVESIASISKCIEALEENLSPGQFNPFEVLFNSIYLEINKKNEDSIPEKVRKSLFHLKEAILGTLISREEFDFVSNQGKTLLIATEPTHVEQLKRLCMDQTEKFVWFTNRKKILHQLHAINIEPIFFSERAFHFHKKHTPLPVFNDTQVIFNIIRVNFSESEGKKLIRLIDRKLCSLNRLANFLKELLQKDSFGKIFVGNDLTTEGRLAILLGKTLNIPTAVIQHGLIGREAVNRFHISDRFFVYGEVFKQVLIQDGLPADRIVVSGAPYLDDIDLTPKRDIHPQLQKQFNIPREGYILVALSGFGHRTSYENYRHTIDILLRASQRFPELPFLFKLHRKDRPAYYYKAAEELGIRGLHICPSDQRGVPTSIFDWFSGCRAVITGTSTVAIEAMLCKVPVISIDPLKEFRGIDFIDRGASINVSALNELEAVLDNIKRGSFTPPGEAERIAGEYFFRGEKAIDIIFRELTSTRANEKIT